MSAAKCAALEALLAAGPDRIDEVEAHCATCVECQTPVAVERSISEVAGALRTTWPSPELWPRIASALAAEESRRAIPFRSAHRSRPVYWQIAAALALLAMLGAVAVVMQRPRRSQDDWVVRTAAIDSVETAERAHVQAIDRLAEVAAPQLEAPATPLLVSYKEKLMLIDDAIAECRTGIETNRYNAHLRRELLAMYVAKERTLEDVVNGEGHVQQTGR
jgi:hypothetical protein